MCTLYYIHARQSTCIRETDILRANRNTMIEINGMRSASTALLSEKCLMIHKNYHKVCCILEIRVDGYGCRCFIYRYNIRSHEVAVNVLLEIYAKKLN